MVRSNLFRHRRAINSKTNTANANEKKWNAKMSEPTSDIKDGNSKMRNGPQQLLLTYYTYTARGRKHPSSRRQSRGQNYTST